MNMRRLRELRLAKGESQEQLAKILGVSRTSYTKYENGQHDPSMEALNMLAEHFNVSVDYLLGREDTKTPSPKDESVYVIEDERAKIMLKWFESLPDHQQDLAIALLRSALEQVNQQKKDQ